MNGFFSFVIAIVVAGAAMTALKMLSGKMNKKHYLVVVVVSMALGVMNSLMPEVAKIHWPSLVFLAVLIYMGYRLMKWFHEEVSDWKEAIPFGVILLINFFMMKAAATGAMGIVPSGEVAGGVNLALKYLPLFILLAEVVFAFYDLFTFEEEIAKISEESERS